jgi:hypothetical protein
LCIQVAVLLYASFVFRIQIGVLTGHRDLQRRRALSRDC